jgi:ERCC4-type nuclease
MAITGLMLDTNEVATAPWTDKLAFGGVAKMTTNLMWGDLMISTSDGDMVIIERKTCSDLLNSIKDNHIFAQAAGMRSLSPWCYLLVTGILQASISGHVIADDRITGWHWDSVQGALISIQEMGVRIVYCLGENEYEATVIRLCNRERSKERIIEPTALPRVMSPGEVLLTSLPGIGLERAQKLLREFDNNPAKALAWLTRKKTTSLAGIGDGIKRAVKSGLCLGEYDEMFVLNSAHYPDVADYLYQAEITEKEILT